MQLRRAQAPTQRFETLPRHAPCRSVDAITIAFGLRNVTRTAVALREARRVLRR